MGGSTRFVTRIISIFLSRRLIFSFRARHTKGGSPEMGQSNIK